MSAGTRGAGGRPSLHDRNVMVLTYWASGDALITRYTMPFVRMIRDQLAPDRGVTVVTFDPAGARRADLSEDRIDHVAFRYDTFGPAAVARRLLDIVRLGALCIRRRIGVIHSWCTPAGALGWLLSVATRRPLVIDSFEPHADSMVENGTWEAGSLRYRLLLALERAQVRRASAAIAVTASMAEYSEARYGRVPEPLYVKPACVDLDLFRPLDAAPGEGGEDRQPHDEGVVGVYAGKFGGIYLRAQAFELMAVLADEFGPGLRFLLLTPTPRAEIIEMAAQAGLPAERLQVLSVPPEEVPRLLPTADFALNFVNPVPTRRYNTSIKDAEYWACGLPLIIAAGISDDSDLVAGANAGAIVHSLSDAGYRDSARRMKSLLAEEPRATRSARIRQLAVEHRNFDSARSVYRDLYGPARP